MPPCRKRSGSVLAYGNGRSYGDSLPERRRHAAAHARPRSLHRASMRDSGILRCEAGVLFSEILDFAVPRGWFLPVTPGTRYVTVGGAIANDVHGKNHHRAGTFGEHVRRFELLRSDGSRLLCSRDENAGLVHRHDRRPRSDRRDHLGRICAQAHRRPVDGDGNAALSTASPNSSRCRRSPSASTNTPSPGSTAPASGKTFGRGLFMRANHAPAIGAAACRAAALERAVHAAVFADQPRQPARVQCAVFSRHARSATHVAHYAPYFYPLDAIGDWNRIYGPRGFLQYQCVVPPANAQATIDRIAAADRRERQRLVPGRAQGVHRPSAGWYPLVSARGDHAGAGFSESRRGNFRPARAARRHRRRGRRRGLSGQGRALAGASASAAIFRSGKKCLPHVDPRFSSGFWRRVMEYVMKKILIIGATSAIAEATARHLRRARRCAVSGRAQCRTPAHHRRRSQRARRRARRQRRRSTSPISARTRPCSTKPSASSAASTSC